MKKYIVYLCMGIMLASLTACGSGDKTGEGQGSAAGSQTGSGATAGDQSGSGATAGDQTGSGATAGNQSGSGATAGNQTEGGAAAGNPAQDGTAAGGSGHNYEDGWTEEMEGIKTAIVDAVGDNYFPNMALLPDMLEMQFGITSDMYDDYFAEMPMISTNVDTLLIIKAKDDKVEDVETALEAYRDVQVSGALQYPMNIGKVQASRIERIGNYVCFVQLGGEVMDIMDNGDEAVVIQCQEMNGLVIDIIRQNVQQE